LYYWFVGCWRFINGGCQFPEDIPGSWTRRKWLFHSARLGLWMSYFYSLSTYGSREVPHLSTSHGQSCSSYSWCVSDQLSYHICLLVENILRGGDTLLHNSNIFIIFGNFLVKSWPRGT